MREGAIKRMTRHCKIGESVVEDVNWPDFKVLVEKSADAMVVVDEEGLVCFANRAAEAMFGRPAPDLTGMPLGLPLIAGETVDISVLRPDGSRVEADMRVVEGTWCGSTALVASLRDMTKQRAIEAQLRQAQKMEAVGQLTAGVAHDFNNILMGVLGNLNLALSRTADDRLRRLLANAEESARRAAKLTAHLLAFSRKQELEIQPVDLNAALKGAEELLRRTVDASVKVETESTEALWPAAADATQVELMLLNLGLNARDAMPVGGVLRLRAHNVPAGTCELPEHLRGRDCVAVSVSDTGTGMSEEVRARAFEPFFTTKPVGKGSGLGLSVVFGVMQQLGGAVRVDTRLGRGTTISLLFARANGEPARDRGEPHQAPTGRGRILIVDDDVAVRGVLEEGLQDHGYDVVVASDGAAALKLIETGMVADLLVTDLAMPGLDGASLAMAARRLRPELPILVVTGYGQAHEANCDGVLRKPFSIAELAQAVRGCIRGADDAVAPRRSVSRA